MTICCPSSVKACVLRVTRLGDFDIPLDPLTPNSRIQTAGFMELNLSPDITKGAVLEIANQCGEVCIIDRNCDILAGFEVQLKVCGVPLAVLEMLTGATLLDDGGGNFLGAALREGRTNNCSGNMMIEVWSKNAARPCPDVDGSRSQRWIQWVLPLTLNWTLSNALNFTSGPLEFTLSGYARNNPNFFPSWPGSEFPSYVPGGGDPTGLPTGPPPTVLPVGVGDLWTLADQAAIRAGGPLAWKCVDSLPSLVSDCGYVPSGEACVPETFVEDFCGPAGAIGSPWIDWPNPSAFPQPVVPLVLSGACSVESDAIDCAGPPI